MSISTQIDDFLGISDVCLSIPVVIGRNGINQKLPIDLIEKEQKQYRRSAKLVRN